MTRAEIIVAIRSGPQFICRGPLSAAARAHINTLLARPDTKALASELDRANRGRDENAPVIIKLVTRADPQLPQIAVLSDGTSEDYVPRPLCGSPAVNTLMVAGPWDGKYRPYCCPRCHVIGIYATPIYPLDD